MFEVTGKYNKAMIYASTVDSASYAQVLRMCNTEALQGAKICMMPDMHAAEGCTVGTSMTVGERVNPAYVGGDIGCGMQVWMLEEESADYARLDEVIREKIPSGAEIQQKSLPALRSLPLDALYCDRMRKDIVLRSFGTLGGGNHFIEMAKDARGRLCLIVHSGSRRLGRDVAMYHQVMAFFEQHGISREEAVRKKLQPGQIRSPIRPGDCFLSGENLTRYLHDMDITVEYARQSRISMGMTIIESMGFTVRDSFATIHNTIDTAAGILRKGAVSAQKGERLLIPINMKDGSLLCTGKGNPDWNCTAPHGSGRVMKRSEAKKAIDLEEYRREMEGIFTTSVGKSTIDESPMAYRRMEEILDAIDPTAEVVDILSPVYNFKASRPVIDEEVMDGED